jgi:cobalt-zinc-cadmium efflux system membrane fusion protein
MFVTALIPSQQIKLRSLYPRPPFRVSKESAVFIRTPEGFMPRRIVTGREDGKSIEVTSGLSPGEAIATINTFVLKADLGRNEAAHAH